MFVGSVLLPDDKSDDIAINLPRKLAPFMPWHIALFSFIGGIHIAMKVELLGNKRVVYRARVEHGNE